jgi:uncharacterized protein YjbI with pentapeptide repeats
MDPARSDAKFQAEFERILQEAMSSLVPADFSGFVFRASRYSMRAFVVDCNFEGATFTEAAHFASSTFAKSADFMGSIFIGRADFAFATFSNSLNFGEAQFNDTAMFGGASFKGDADFELANFSRGAYFQDAEFNGGAIFDRAEFHRRSTFSFATMSGAASFKDVRFRHDFTKETGLDFSDVKILHPEQVEFYKADLGQVLFYNTDVSGVNFTLVSWRDRGRIESYLQRRRLFPLRRLLSLRGRSAWNRRWELLARIAGRRSPRLCVFEEVADTTDLWRLRNRRHAYDTRDYGLIAETYQQLKRNYDAKGDYWTAGHFHFGEMEMRRMETRWRFRPLRWLSRHLSLVALYKYASAYGESYTLPLIWLAAVLTVFGLLYPLVGFYPITGLELNAPGLACVRECSLNYWNYGAFFSAHPAEAPSGWPGILMHSLMTSVSVAGFQRELRYTPSYPWGRLLALLELLITTSLGGLFALAIRRQFKRA